MTSWTKTRARVIAAAIATAGVAPVVAAPYAYVVNAAGYTVSVIDTATDAVVGAPIPVGSRPRAMASDRSGTRLYVANDNGNSVSVIDTASASVVAIIEGIPAPTGLIVDARGARLFVSTRTNVLEIDTATLAVVGNPLPIATADTVGCPTVVGTMAADVDVTRLYIPISDCAAGPYNAPGQLTVVDIPTRSALATIPVGRYPMNVTVARNGARA